MRRHKFGAVAMVVDGHRFPSKRESRRYQELRLLEQAGLIQGLELQPRFDLTVNGVRIGAYVGDFQYVDTSNGEVVTEDAKGVRTPIYRWKVKHLKAEHGIEVKEV